MICLRSNAKCVWRRCYIVDDQAEVVISIDHVKRDLESIPLKVKEPRAFSTLLRNGVLVRRRRMNGVVRCLTGRQRYQAVSRVPLSFYYRSSICTSNPFDVRRFIALSAISTCFGLLWIVVDLLYDKSTTIHNKSASPQQMHNKFKAVKSSQQPHVPQLIHN